MFAFKKFFRFYFIFTMMADQFFFFPNLYSVLKCNDKQDVT